MLYFFYFFEQIYIGLPEVLYFVPDSFFTEPLLLLFFIVVQLPNEFTQLLPQQFVLVLELDFIGQVFTLSPESFLNLRVVEIQVEVVLEQGQTLYFELWGSQNTHFLFHFL